VYYIVFGVILGTDRGVENYTLWLTVGVFAYRLTSSTVVEGARSISSNQGLMRSIRFPRALLPVSVVLSNIYSFGFQLCVLAFVAFATGEGASSRWLALPFVLTVHTALNLGGAFIAARLNDSFRDIQQIIPFLFNLLRYMSGVMFPISRFLEGNSTEHAALRPFIENNPMRHVLAMYRWVFLGEPMALGDIARIMIISAALLFIGFSFFRAAEWRYGRN
jgi:teichoic acid transport system permease protein